jgi:hypothetical protein
MMDVPRYYPKSKKEVKTMAKNEEIEEDNEEPEEQPKRGRTFGDPIAEVEF